MAGLVQYGGSQPPGSTQLPGAGPPRYTYSPPPTNALAQDQAAAAQVTDYGDGQYVHSHPTIGGHDPASGNALGSLPRQGPTPTGSMAGTTLPPGPTGIENNPYIANFQKSLAASRGAIAAQIAAAMHEIGTNEAAGRADVNAFGGSLGTMNADEHNALNALATGADKSMAAGGLKSYTPAAATTAPLGAAGDMATHFAQGAVPLLQQGVGAQAQAQTNALQLYGLQANAALDQELRGFDAQQANDISNRNFQREQANTAFTNQLTLRDLASNDPTQNPIIQQHLRATQAALDKGSIDSFTADQIPALRSSPQYSYLKGITDPQQRALAAAQEERLGHKNVVDLARLDGLIP